MLQSDGISYCNRRRISTLSRTTSGNIISLTFGALFWFLRLNLYNLRWHTHCLNGRVFFFVCFSFLFFVAISLVRMLPSDTNIEHDFDSVHCNRSLGRCIKFQIHWNRLALHFDCDCAVILLMTCKIAYNWHDEVAIYLWMLNFALFHFDSISKCRHSTLHVCDVTRGFCA